MQIKCQICKKSIIKLNTNHRYCTPCGIKRTNDNIRKWNREHHVKKRVSFGSCNYCGIRIKKKNGRKTCSSTCGTKFNNLKTNIIQAERSLKNKTLRLEKLKEILQNAV